MRTLLELLTHDEQRLRALAHGSLDRGRDARGLGDVQHLEPHAERLGRRWQLLRDEGNVEGFFELQSTAMREAVGIASFSSSSVLAEHEVTTP